MCTRAYTLVHTNTYATKIHTNTHGSTSGHLHATKNTCSRARTSVPQHARATDVYKHRSGHLTRVCFGRLSCTIWQGGTFIRKHRTSLYPQTQSLWRIAFISLDKWVVVNVCLFSQQHSEFTTRNLAGSRGRKSLLCVSAERFHAKRLRISQSLPWRFGSAIHFQRSSLSVMHALCRKYCPVRG